MKTETTRFVVQFKSIFGDDPEWRTYDDKYLSIPAAYKDLEALKAVNPNVRLIKRTITEVDISQL